VVPDDTSRSRIRIVSPRSIGSRIRPMMAPTDCCADAESTMKMEAKAAAIMTFRKRNGGMTPERRWEAGVVLFMSLRSPDYSNINGVINLARADETSKQVIAGGDDRPRRKEVQGREIVCRDSNRRISPSANTG
jgi:hypothetical protein